MLTGSFPVHDAPPMMALTVGFFGCSASALEAGSPPGFWPLDLPFAFFESRPATKSLMEISCGGGFGALLDFPRLPPPLFGAIVY